MLVARGNKTVGRTLFHWALGFGGGWWLKTVECDGLVRDVRFIPGVAGTPKANVCLVLIPSGFFEVLGDGQREDHRYDAPVAFAMTLEQWEGAHGRRSFLFRMGGPNHCVLRLNLPHDALRSKPVMPGPIHLDAETWTLVSRAARLSQSDDATFASSVEAVVRRLAALGLLTQEAAARIDRQPPPGIERLWGTLQPLIEQMALGTTADAASAMGSLSPAQFGRAFRTIVSSFALVGPGIRNVMHRLRLETAIILLTAEGAAITEVARAVGYGSVDAMARAFRDAGIEAPSIVRERMMTALRPASERSIG